MIVRRGDKVVCTKCNFCQECIGTIDSFSDWYGETVVSVYFEDAKWDHCDHDVFYLSDLEANESAQRAKEQSESINVH